MTTYFTTTTITKLVGPDAEEIEIPVCIKGEILEPDRDVGIMSEWCEGVEITDDDGNEIEVSEAENDRLCEVLMESWTKSQGSFPVREGPPSEFYD